ncbi:hypothetical protein [Bacteroides sp. An19]|uniref:hypothetical protein n=1 Tax=Bacteroides sp. An19 TaxID=1965580 RepID=UPI001123ADFD|nr:hypothetical protein [Bacteroides sp. An19]
MGQTIACKADKRGRLLAETGIRGCFSKAEAPVCQPRTTCVRLPSLRGSAQWTDVRKDRHPLIVPGREAGYVCYKRNGTSLYKR